jgi:hypothetical protein
MNDSDRPRDEVVPWPLADKSADAEGLFIPDSEMYRRLGVSPRIGRMAVLALERSGFPPKLPLWGNRRYWPAIRAFLDRHYGAVPYNRFRHGPDGQEMIAHAQPRLKEPDARLLGRAEDAGSDQS